ncbi:unnamed protein product [Linum trigynum]|uniref:Reverse transcriptase zinc-binding domain-containing protein n=1 Tax=Linum trigynum TaxID=586398 RepID=A0AAV2CTZ8_9ROSI
MLKCKEQVHGHLSVINGVGSWDGKVQKKFPLKQVWDFFRPKLPVVSWYKLVWSQPAMPRDQFLCWLITRGYLTTGDKLLSWGYQGDFNCAFCATAVETLNHLFAECSRYKGLYSCLFSKFTSRIPSNSWEVELNWAVTAFAGPSATCRVGRIIWQSLISSIWRDKCKAKHGKQILSLEKVQVRVKSDLEVLCEAEDVGKFL